MVVSHLRLVLENLQKYGLLFNITEHAQVFVQDPYVAHGVLLLTCTFTWYIFTLSVALSAWIVYTFLIEWYASNGYKKGQLQPFKEVAVALAHIVGLSSVLLVPCAVVWHVAIHPAAGIVIMTLMTILWLKLISYVLINKALRTGSTNFAPSSGPLQV